MSRTLRPSRIPVHQVPSIKDDSEESVLTPSLYLTIPVAQRSREPEMDNLETTDVSYKDLKRKEAARREVSGGASQDQAKTLADGSAISHSLPSTSASKVVGDPQRQLESMKLNKELSDSEYLMQLLVRRSHQDSDAPGCDRARCTVGDAESPPPEQLTLPTPLPRSNVPASIEYDERGQPLIGSLSNLTRPGAYSGYCRRQSTRRLYHMLGLSGTQQGPLDVSGTENTTLEASCHRLSSLELRRSSGSSSAQPHPSARRKGQCYVLLCLVALICVIILVSLLAVFFGGVVEDSSQDLAHYERQTMPPKTVNFSLVPALSNQTLEAMKDAGSPQRQAYEWVEKDPNWDSYEDWQKQQRFALASVYYSLGVSTLHQLVLGARRQWMSYYFNECEWMPAIGRDPCPQGDGRLHVLDLASFSRIKGSVPNEIALLSHLEVIDFSGSKVHSDLETLLPLTDPNTLPSLRELRLSECQLYGSLPSTLGLLTNLVLLDLRWNDFNSTIPPELGQLTDMSTLLLAANELTGRIPDELADLPVLVEFSLEMNAGLEPFIPDGFCNSSDYEYIPIMELKTDWCSSVDQCCSL